jgi:hypothetical protein
MQTVSTVSQRPRPPQNSGDAHAVVTLPSTAPARVVVIDGHAFRDDGVAADILGSGQSILAIQSALRLASFVSRGAGPHAQAFAFATDGGGIAVEYELAETARELSFSVPDVPSVRYFVARGRGFRSAGIVLDDSALHFLGQWLARENSPFPSSGLEIGRHSQLGR